MYDSLFTKWTNAFSVSIVFVSYWASLSKAGNIKKKSKSKSPLATEQLWALCLQDTDVPVWQNFSPWGFVSLLAIWQWLPPTSNPSPPPPSLKNHTLRGSWWHPKHEVVTGLSNPNLDVSLEDLLLWPTGRLPHMPSPWNKPDLLFSHWLQAKVSISLTLNHQSPAFRSMVRLLHNLNRMRLMRNNW